MSPDATMTPFQANRSVGMGSDTIGGDALLLELTKGVIAIHARLDLMEERLLAVTANSVSANLEPGKAAISAITHNLGVKSEQIQSHVRQLAGLEQRLTQATKSAVDQSIGAMNQALAKGFENTRSDLATQAQGLERTSQSQAISTLKALKSAVEELDSRLGDQGDLGVARRLILQEVQSTSSLTRSQLQDAQRSLTENTQHLDTRVKNAESKLAALQAKQQLLIVWFFGTVMACFGTMPIWFNYHRLYRDAGPVALTLTVLAILVPILITWLSGSSQRANDDGPQE